MADTEIDVRDVPRPQRHRHIFAAFGALDVGDALVLVNDHEPRHLRDEFEAELAGGFTWERIDESAGATTVRVRIGKTARTALPRIVGDTSALAETDRGGSVWQLSPAARDLDANVIALPAGDEIAAHDGPDLDVLIHVLSGSGTLETEGDDIALTPGAMVWMPRRARRRIVAGAEGLRYFSVHQRKPMLGLQPTVRG